LIDRDHKAASGESGISEESTPLRIETSVAWRSVNLNASRDTNHAADAPEPHCVVLAEQPGRSVALSEDLRAEARELAVD
jgi:hypothetical protein